MITFQAGNGKGAETINPKAPDLAQDSISGTFSKRMERKHTTPQF